ncbi:hypothetical protein D3D03_08955 [Exiguobacterium sp. RIT452]|uniref:hypothetical protein n=1 Tax=Exiguobacterium sp. RIT452 TaxID=2315552 RepID=UPI000E717F0D|nr:hypothetical protein [Exiguobacterium sp. RIT452]RJP00912.1 hypothetical protein D3D03_08955 [Exiguobacterium sp. RIT452]
MNDFDGFDLIFKIAIPIFFILISLKVLIYKKVTKKPTFFFNFLLNLLLYIVEILMMFVIIRQILMFYGTTLSGTNDSLPKQFVDFFTAYQILIFVLIKLYDSLAQNDYVSLIYKTELVQPRIDENEMIEDSLIESVKYRKNSNYLPSNVRFMFNKLYDFLDQYNCLLVKIENDLVQVKNLKNKLLNKNATSEKRVPLQVSLNQLKFELDTSNEEMKRIKFAIHDLKIDAIREKEKREFHWNVSILLRLFR